MRNSSYAVLFSYFCNAMEHRKIIHIDMDAFFASVEQLDNPALRGCPIAVGYDGKRGVVSTASYEARKYGVHSAMSVAQAKKLCQHLIVVESHFHRYKEISQQIHEIFRQYTDLIEPLSLDEAFLDVTENKMGIALAQDIAMQIKHQIRERTHLTASAGVSYNKFLAKIASDYRKPDGLFVIHPDRAQSFIDQLPIERFWGVGQATTKKMHFMGIFNGKQLREVSRRHLVEVFGKMGETFFEFARGIDQRPVVTDYERKSVGCEHTFEEDIWKESALLIQLHHTVIELEQRLQKANFTGKILTLKVKYADFQQITRSQTASANFHTKQQILPVAKHLLQQTDISSDHPIRLMGLSVSKNTTADTVTTNKVWEEGWLDFDFWEAPEHSQ